MTTSYQGSVGPSLLSVGPAWSPGEIQALLLPGSQCFSTQQEVGPPFLGGTQALCLLRQ